MSVDRWIVRDEGAVVRVRVSNRVQTVCLTDVVCVRCTSNRGRFAFFDKINPVPAPKSWYLLVRKSGCGKIARLGPDIPIFFPQAPE